MMILDTLFPLFALLLLGSLLKKFQITNEAFLKTADKLVYYIFFPVMLFWKIGNSLSHGGLNLGLCLAGIFAVVLVFGLSLFLFAKVICPGYRQVLFPRPVIGSIPISGWPSS